MTQGIQNTSRLHGERDTMWSKEKLSKEILGLTGAAAIVAIFVLGFIRVTAQSVVLAYCEKNGVDFSESMEVMVDTWIPGVSLVAAVAIFVVLFLFLIGEKIEQAVTEIVAKEVQLREEREQLVRSLSHDIRTPLTSISSYSEYIEGKEGVTESEVQEYASLMRQKAEQIKSLTDRLLDDNRKKLEKIEDGRLLMMQLAEEWEGELESALGGGLCLNLSLECCPTFSGEFDVQELRRIFDNLASNIKKYADASQEICLEIKETESFLTIIQENKKKDTVLDVESYKIGLKSIRKIAENYGGKVVVQETDDAFSVVIHLMQIH